ncbi:hypothetical protein D3C72_2332730 [compost metagenome]
MDVVGQQRQPLLPGFAVQQARFPEQELLDAVGGLAIHRLFALHFRQGLRHRAHATSLALFW